MENKYIGELLNNAPVKRTGRKLTPEIREKMILSRIIYTPPVGYQKPTDEQKRKWEEENAESYRRRKAFERRKEIENDFARTLAKFNNY